MNAVCEIAVADARGVFVRGQVLAEAVRHWAGLPELATLDLYVPAAGTARDPYVDDGAAPAIAILEFASVEAFERAARHSAFAAGLACLPAGATCTAMRRLSYPIAGEKTIAPLMAPFSYVVRYHRPAEDEALFVNNYLDTHPNLLGRLPGIRNVLCYLPLPWRHAGGLPPADYMLGNEVVFDDIAAFNAAMASPLRHELRAHYRQFPAFSGRNTHYAMDRTRLVG